MATKNPKRVAAGKKAWRNRSAASKSRFSGGKGTRRKKPIQRGIGGRIGAFVLGVVPTAGSGLDAAENGYKLHKQKVNIIGIGKVSLFRFINNLGNGFLGVTPFEDYMEVTRTDGSTFNTKPGVGIPKGAWLVTSGVGLFMMVEDYVAAKLAGGRPVKIIGTNYNATGGS